MIEVHTKEYNARRADRLLGVYFSIDVVHRLQYQSSIHTYHCKVPVCAGPGTPEIDVPRPFA